MFTNVSVFFSDCSHCLCLPDSADADAQFIKEHTIQDMDLIKRLETAYSIKGYTKLQTVFFAVCKWYFNETQIC
jgi:hypothetical protein